MFDMFRVEKYLNRRLNPNIRHCLGSLIEMGTSSVIPRIRSRTKVLFLGIRGLLVFTGHDSQVLTKEGVL